MKIRDLQKWQIKRLALMFLFIVIPGIIFLVSSVVVLYNDKLNEDVYWTGALTQPQSVTDRVNELSGNETKVTAGTYVENLKEIALKTSNYRLEFMVWFRWEGRPDLDMANNFRIYKGTINKKEIVKDYHEGSTNYQLVRVDATVSKNFWTKRFPLESHQLRFYIEPNYTASDVVFVADTENSGINESISISGYYLRRYGVASYAVEYQNTRNDPEVEKDVVTSELVTAFEINRNSFGLYFKCFIALVGTTTWVLITLFLCTYHRVDPIGMVPAALFGTVANIMVGANLLPDALDLGLLEFVNFWGIFTIIAVMISIININRIRSKYEDKEFASLFGKIMFYTILILTVVGHSALPIAAFMAR